MKARELLGSVFLQAALPDCEIEALTDRSDRATQNSVFVCIKGARADGHELALDAYERGCRVFVAEHSLPLPEDATVLLTASTRATLSHLASLFYGEPSKRLQIVGITGTKGKTTTAQMLVQILKQNHVNVGYIGTNGICYGETEGATLNTTPDPLTLHRTLAQMEAAGVTTVVLEVSSQALMQERVRDVRFTSVLFTNLYPDHIGVNEHPSFAHYRDTKHRLFTDFDTRYAFFNTDDASAAEMMRDCRAQKCLRCGLDAASDYRITGILPTMENGVPGVSFTLLTEGTGTAVTLPLMGTCNAYNALLAMAVAKEAFGISERASSRALADARVAGRAECIPLPTGACGVIDYAHNGESMRQILSSLRAYRPHRLIVLFGSVGERSQLRRAELGRAAAELSDLAILTSDNPGNEDPCAILEEIAAAFEGSKTPFYKIPDRAEAIRAAVRMTEPGDILLLAGKGHERYQLIGREKRPFCESDILADIYRELRGLPT